VRRSCIEEDIADGYELEVEVGLLNEDVAEYSDSVTV